MWTSRMPVGLGVGDAEVRAGRVVEAQLADSEVAQLADAHAAVAEDRADRATAGVATGVCAEVAQVPGDGSALPTELGGQRAYRRRSPGAVPDLGSRPHRESGANLR
jgi:hypothetical protein